MKIISYGKQKIDQNDVDAVCEVLKQDYLTQGPQVEKFETDLSSYFGSKYCCAVSSGTAALHLAGIALGWSRYDIVITTPITFLATVNAILYARAKPDFVDIDPFTYTIDPNKLEEKIKDYDKKGKRVKCVIGVDYAGLPCDWKALRFLADKYEFKLINDNCHAMGASYFGDKNYSTKYADIAVHSYHPVKPITTGEGGAILTNNAQIDSKVRELRTHGMTKNPSKLEKVDGPWYYEMHQLGFNYRLTDFQCALGISQLKKLDSFIKRRKHIARKYNEHLKNFKDVILPPSISSSEHAFHLYPIKINFDKKIISKNNFFTKMKEDGILLQVHYIPVHLQPFYKKKFGFKSGDYPHSENFYSQEFSFPIFPSLKERDQEYVIDKIKIHLA